MPPFLSTTRRLIPATLTITGSIRSTLLSMACLTNIREEGAILINVDISPPIIIRSSNNFRGKFPTVEITRLHDDMASSTLELITTFNVGSVILWIIHRIHPWLSMIPKEMVDFSKERRSRQILMTRPMMNSRLFPSNTPPGLR